MRSPDAWTCPPSDSRNYRPWVVTAVNHRLIWAVWSQARTGLSLLAFRLGFLPQRQQGQSRSIDR